MFNTILKDHRASTAQSRKQLDILRSEALTSCETVTQHLFHQVQNGVGLIYKNQRALQTEAQILQAHSTRFSKQSEKWLALSAQLNNALKELGDVQNWALTIQKDMRFIETNLAQVVEGNNHAKLQMKDKREKELARKVAEKEEAERIKREDKERKQQQKFAAQQAPFPMAIPPTTQIHPPTQTQHHVEHVDAGEDEELP